MHKRKSFQANPPGIQVSLTVVVSFHDSFITRVDRAYQVVCAYEEHEHTVTYKMDIEYVSCQYAMPCQCSH